jgi:hypothetical protein
MAPFYRRRIDWDFLTLGFGGYFLAVCSPSFALGRGNAFACARAQYSLLRSRLFPGRSPGAYRPSTCVSELRLDFPYLFVYTLSFNFVTYQSHL